MSAIDWLGEIEPSWGYAPLFTLGSSKKTPNVGLIEQNLLSLSYGRVVPRDIESSEGLVPASYETYQIVEPGDTVLRFTDLQNDQRSLRSGLVTQRGIITSAYMSFTPDRSKIHPGFFAHMMRAVDINKVFYRMGSGVRQSLNWSEFSLMRLPFPPLETQQRIADYLDRETAEIDAAVADLDRYGALLEKRKKNQINLAFAPIIEAKEVTPLGVFYSISNGDRGENYPKADEITDQGIPFLNAGDIRKGSVSLNAAKFVTREKYNAMGGAKLRAGDILFCLRGSLGKHGVVDFDEGSVASSLCVIRPLDSSAHSSHFLNYFMETTFFAEQILFAENGSAQPNLSGESLARFRIPASPISEQKRILRDLDRGTAEIDALIEESMKLRDLLLKRRSVLITEVVTGRKQV